nr:unnamed protein product [Spirometra erinaceieuropaei]
MLLSSPFSFSSSFSSSTAPSTAAQATGTYTTTDSSDEDQNYICPHCDHTFTSHIGLVGQLRIHRTETRESVPGAPPYAHRSCLHCPHCPRTFTHRMGLSGHIRIYESGIDRRTDSCITPNPTPNMITLRPHSPSHNQH